jgi:hypothetical protein
VEARSKARARSYWRQIGLPATAPAWADGPGEQALALAAALDELFRSPPRFASQVEGMWAEEAARNPLLADLDPGPIVKFLTGRLFGADRGGTSQAAEAHPLLLSTRPMRRRGGEPFVPWLFSRQGIGPKLRVAAAAVLVVSGVLLVRRDTRERGVRFDRESLLLRETAQKEARERQLAAEKVARERAIAAQEEAERLRALALDEARRRKARDESFRRMIGAGEARDDQGVILGAEGFLSHPPTDGKDAREGRVVELYKAALVRWNLGRDGRDDAEARQHLETFRTLVSGPGRRGRAS